MIDPMEVSTDPARRSLMDEFLRAGVPEVKLALGDLIDRENARPLPAKYARLMPDTVLVVTLRDDAADALEPIAANLERELTDSCNRHGSLYDRTYRVRLQRSGDPDAALYTVTALAGRDEGSDGPGGGPAPSPPEGAQPPRPAIPVGDPDATRLEPASPLGWVPGRWLLVVEDAEGEEREAFRITDPVVTIGRSSDDPALRSAISISEAPHVSRRQLALAWEERDGAPGFRLFNLGLNEVHLPGQELTGARVGKGSLDLAQIPAESTGWLPPGVPLRIGDHGPTVRIDEVPPGEADVPIDPDATVFE
ncbi:MAG TPA: FHA domain-containing protein [Longimicrobiaceae bacterium]|nr:FHA domain-containing protein [Longimicrobiaceae bacterium]